MLRGLEARKLRCYDGYAEHKTADEEFDALPSITTDQVADWLDDCLDLKDGLYEDESNANGTNGQVTPENSDPDELDDDGDHPRISRASGHTSKSRFALIERHIRLLCDDPRQFAQWVSARRGGEWKVDFPSLGRTLIYQELADTVRARFGATACRIIRLLQGRGKLEEKDVVKYGMVRPKDARHVLGVLQQCGYVELQEVPKDNMRNVVKTIHLWSYDPERCREVIANDTYKAMARILQRTRVEKAKIQPVIEKAERTDVVGNEDQYLNGGERGALKEWREREEKLLAQLGKQDELISVFKDFVKPGPPLPPANHDDEGL